MRCNAKSKQTKNQCGAHAIKGKTKCKYHGGWSKGPTSDEGLKKCADVNLQHGRFAKSAKEERSVLSNLIKQCDEILRSFDV